MMNAVLIRALRKTHCVDHLKEFGTCIGIVQGPTHAGWPEVDVRWQPSNLRYGYHSKYLKPATRHKR